MSDTNIQILADRKDIVAVADAVRAKTGTAEALTLGGMVTAIEDIDVGSDPVLQDKTVTPTTSSQTVTADSGYDGLDTVTVNAMPTATQATPTVSIDSAGKITATATQTAGYVVAGTKTGTKQMTTQAAKTITPSTSSQTAVAKNVYTTGAVTVAAIPSTYVKPTVTKAATTYTPTTSNQTIAAGTYCSGIQTIKGDANLRAENIAEGVSIFGVTGTHSGGSAGGSVETCTLIASYVTTASECCFTAYENNEVVSYYFPFKDYGGLCSDILVSNNVIKNSIVTLNAAHPFSNLEPLKNNSSAQYKIVGDAIIRYNPCFAINTLITLADGTTKFVQDITYQDNLLVWDFDKGCYSSAKPIWIKKAQTTDYYYLCKFANGAELKLIGSDGKCHRVFDVENGRFESATDCVGKRVISSEGETVLLSCERVDEEVEFYNIITHTHINLFAEGMLTSCRLNNIYPIQNMKFIKDSRTKKLREDYPKIGSDVFRGLRIAEQSMSKEEIDTYVERLYALIDWKARYFVDDHTGTGNIIELTEAEYLAVTGTKETCSYASQVYHGEISIEDVPEELREEVQTIVANKIARWGEYQNQNITLDEFQNMIAEVL